MKKAIIKFGILFMIILFLPYVMTNLLSGYKKLNQSTKHNDISIFYETNEGKEYINFENYIIGVVAATIPADYELEAIKAQAVVVRTYVLGIIDKLKEKGYKDEYSVEQIGLDFMSTGDMKNKWDTQQYKENLSKMKEGVYSTKDEVMIYDQKLIEPLFHRVSVGKTRSAKEAFGEDIPYLQEVDSISDVACKEYMMISEDTVDNAIKVIGTQFLNIKLNKSDFFNQVKVTKRDSLGYVLNVQVRSKKMTGEEFAKLFRLNSSNFYIENYEDKVRLITKGYGHGVGFSQFGGNQMAVKGNNYRKILAYYYQKVEVIIK